MLRHSSLQITNRILHFHTFSCCSSIMAARTVSRSCIQSSHTSPAVRAFLQLVSYRPHLVLDFLVPRVSQHANPLPLRSGPRAPSRAFSTTSALKETVAIFNPRKDENGQDMNVEITPRASNVSYM